jgi:predicted outer membrane repeat protein
VENITQVRTIQYFYKKTLAYFAQAAYAIARHSGYGHLKSPSTEGEPSRRALRTLPLRSNTGHFKEETVRTEVKSAACVVLVAILLPTLIARANVRYVASDGGGQDGLSWSSAYQSIPDALLDSDIDSGDEIWVKAGTYTVGLTIRVTKAVKILGGFSGDGDTRDSTANVTTISGDGLRRCMTISANAWIEGFTFTQGNIGGDATEARGGAIYIGDCSPTVTKCTFSGNRAAARGGAIATKNASGATMADCSFSGNRAGLLGGAIANQGSNVSISNCTFHANKANEDSDFLGGGGIYNEQCSPTISGCTFTGNIAVNGAGICNYMADALVEGCTFSDNDSKTTCGGGVMNYGCSATISRCLFRNNTAYYGGAIYDESTSTIVNCIMWKNSSSMNGGAIHIETSDGHTNVQPKITNCTIYGNTANFGGGLHATIATAIVRNCIIWGNGANLSGPGIYQPSTAIFKLEVQKCDVQGDSTYPGTGNVRVEPAFANPDAGNFELVWGSPCIDIGDGTAPGLGAVDFAGKPRVVDGNEDHIAVIDLGALEFRGRYLDDYLLDVEISQSIVYHSPTDTNPDHVFLLTATTGDVVNQIQFSTPGGHSYTITNAAHATPASHVDTYHTVKDGKHVWEYLGTFPSFPLLSDYGDGNYSLTLLYKDGTSHHTNLWYGIPGSSETLIRPTQAPHITSPSYGGPAVSPVVLTWDACTDEGVNTIYVGVLDPNTKATLTCQSLDTAATQDTGFSLGEATYGAQIAFQNRFDLKNSDNIPFVYGKSVIVPYQFQVPYSTIYRFWAPKEKRHFYTMKESEKQKLIDKYASVWTYEGPVFNGCATRCHNGLVPVYRFWSPKAQTHFYTIKESEKDKLIQTMSKVWTFEGVAFFAYAPDTQPSGCKPVYRFWNAGAGTHFYTMTESEKDKLVNTLSNIYTYEGIAFYAYAL